MDFTKVTLLPEELRLLKRLARHSPRTLSGTDESIARAISYHFRLIDLSGTYDFSINDNGLRYLIWRRDDRFRHRWPVYLSVLAILISVAALIRSFWG